MVAAATTTTATTSERAVAAATGCHADDATKSIFHQQADRELREDQFKRAARIFIKQTYDAITAASLA